MKNFVLTAIITAYALPAYAQDITWRYLTAYESIAEAIAANGLGSGYKFCTLVDGWTPETSGLEEPPTFIVLLPSLKEVADAGLAQTCDGIIVSEQDVTRLPGSSFFIQVQ